MYCKGRRKPSHLHKRNLTRHNTKNLLPAKVRRKESFCSGNVFNIRDNYPLAMPWLLLHSLWNKEGVKPADLSERWNSCRWWSLAGWGGSTTFLVWNMSEGFYVLNLLKHLPTRHTPVNLNWCLPHNQDVIRHLWAREALFASFRLRAVDLWTGSPLASGSWVIPALVAAYRTELWSLID